MSAGARAVSKAAAVVGLVLGAVVCLTVYSSLSLTEKARTPGLDPEAKIRVLRSARTLFAWNESAFEEAGVTFLGRATDNLGEIDRARADIREARSSLRRALKLNPGSAAAHLYYAKTLDLLKYLDTTGGERSFAEYEKAARLAGPDRSLIRDIGAILFGRWANLSEAERSFALDLLKRTLLPKDEARFREVLQIWDMDIRDDAVMQKIIPDSPPLLRMYAQLLADKNLSLEARHKTLARAERLEYEQAWKGWETGQNSLKMGMYPEAVQHLGGALAGLGRIKFYGHLIGDEKIGAEVEKKTTLRRTVALDLAKAKVEEKRDLAQAQDALAAYLALEDNYKEITELETYLKGLRIIPESEAAAPIKNIRQLSFDVLLMFKLHKYRQIISLGGQLQQSILPSDPAARKDLAAIFRMVGESYQKLDFVYEPEGYYEKALELFPGNPEVLLRMKKYYERRNETEKIREVDELLAKILSLGDLVAKPLTLAKGEAFAQSLLMSVGQDTIRLSFRAEPAHGNPKPLMAVVLNDRVYWEDYPGEGEVVLELDVGEGYNRLEIIAINGPAVLAKVTAAAVEQEKKP